MFIGFLYCAELVTELSLIDEHVVDSGLADALTLRLSASDEMAECIEQTFNVDVSCPLCCL